MLIKSVLFKGLKLIRNITWTKQGRSYASFEVVTRRGFKEVGERIQR